MRYIEATSTSMPVADRLSTWKSKCDVFWFTPLVKKQSAISAAVRQWALPTFMRHGDAFPDNRLRPYTKTWWRKYYVWVLHEHLSSSPGKKRSRNMRARRHSARIAALYRALSSHLGLATSMKLSYFLAARSLYWAYHWWAWWRTLRMMTNMPPRLSLLTALITHALRLSRSKLLHVEELAAAWFDDK